MLYTFRPESPLVETMKFMTDVLLHKDGSEQRVCMRTGPRTSYNCTFILEDGKERAILENALYGSQGTVWTVPAWPEVAFLSAAASLGATSISADHSTADFRVGQQAIVYGDEYTYDVLDTITLGSGTIGFTGALAHNWPLGTEVYPLKDFLIQGQVKKRRYPLNLAEITLQFEGIDSSVNLFTGTLATGTTLSFVSLGLGPDTAAIVLTDPNAIDSTLSEGSTRTVTIIDSITGKVSPFDPWLNSRATSQKGFVVHNHADLWAIRVLLHSFNGQQQSFFLPTHAQDLVPTAGLTSGAATLTVANCDFTTQVAGKSRKYVRVELVDGTHVDRTILSSVATSSTVETITFTSNWSATVALANITRITIYQRVRLAADDVVIKHTSLNGEAAIQFAVTEVIE